MYLGRREISAQSKFEFIYTQERCCLLLVLHGFIFIVFRSLVVAFLRLEFLPS